MACINDSSTVDCSPALIEVRNVRQLEACAVAQRRIDLGYSDVVNPGIVLVVAIVVHCNLCCRDGYQGAVGLPVTVASCGVLYRIPNSIVS